MYQLWIYYGTEGFQFVEFETLEEVIAEPKYSYDWYVTKKVDLVITENES